MGRKKICAISHVQICTVLDSNQSTVLPEGNHLIRRPLFFIREVTTERILQEHQRGCFAEENTEPGAGQQEAPCRGLQGILSPPVVFIVLVR
jgi:hypothetical protein